MKSGIIRQFALFTQAISGRCRELTKQDHNQISEGRNKEEKMMLVSNSRQVTLINSSPALTK